MNNHSVSTGVYSYNPNGIALLVVYIPCLFVFIFHLLSLSMTQILVYGSLFLAVPLYVQYGNNRKIRLMVWEERMASTKGMERRAGWRTDCQSVLR